MMPSGPGSMGRVPRFTSSFAAGPGRAHGVLGLLRELAAALSATHVRTSPSWVPLPEGCSDPCPTARLWRQLAVGPLTSGALLPATLCAVHTLLWASVRGPGVCRRGHGNRLSVGGAGDAPIGIQARGAGELDLRGPGWAGQCCGPPEVLRAWQGLGGQPGPLTSQAYSAPSVQGAVASRVTLGGWPLGASPTMPGGVRGVPR